MRTCGLVLLCLIIVLGASAAGAGERTVTVSKVVPFAEGCGASGNVKSECTLETRFPEFIKAYAKKGVKVVLSEEPLENVEGPTLHMEFSLIVGHGGGAWSGPKWVEVTGELRENGEVIGSFVAKRFSGGGAFGGFKGTCSILGRCIKAMGSDIARWLKNPSMDARLGDA